VNDGAVLRAGHEHLQAVPVAQPPDIEVLLHRVRRGQQADSRSAGFVDRRRGGVRDVDERNVDRLCDGIGDLVHGVGAEHDQLGPGGHKRARLHREQVARLFPSSGALERLNVGEINRAHKAVGRMQARPPRRSRTASLTSR
jgi:hypothetical protein